MIDAVERVVFEGVDVVFPAAGTVIPVIRGVSFAIRQGEFVCIIGPSGCGKTTLLNLLAGFLQPTRGRVLLDGKPVKGPGSDRGVIFQDYGVFPWLTVRQNIEFGLKLKAGRTSAGERDEICHRYLNSMGLAEFADAYPRTLSGGMRQRLAIARAYAVRPQFLLMDEPFGALDALTRSNMQELLLELQQAESKTILMITHSVDEALYLSSRIVVVTARPARVREIVDVPFGYPRSDTLHATPEFAVLRTRLHALVMQEYAQQQRQGRERAAALAS